MSQKITTWHPKFSFYCFKDIGVLLVNETSFFWLPNQLFPSISLIDNNRSIDDIINKLSGNEFSNISLRAQFIYQSNQLKKQGFLCDIDHKLASHYQIPLIREVSQLHHDKGVEILSISSALDSNLIQWVNAIKSTLKRNFINDFSLKKLTFILVDDLLDKRIEEVISKYEYVCVIKITGDCLSFTPLFKTVSTTWLELQQAVYRNQPVRHFLARLYPEKIHVIPFEKKDVLLPVQLNAIKSLLQSQLMEKNQYLLQFNVIKNSTTQHAIHNSKVQDVANNSHFNQPIKLQHVKSVFNKDGGSRAIAPAATVKKLMPFVDAITGYIPNILELLPDNDDPIKIYRTAFFKTPLKRNLISLSNDDIIQSCLGKGVTHEQSQASALCEAIERLNAQFQGNEPLLQKKPEQLTKRYINFQKLTPYSTAQYEKFTDPRHPESKRKQAARSYNNEEIYWLATWSLTNQEQVYVPLTCCFANVEFNWQQAELKTLEQNKMLPEFNDDKFGRWHSNGAAAGNTLEEAILQGLFELIERDAAAIWWYNKVERPAFDLTKIDDAFYKPLEQTLAKNHNYWVLDLTNDLGIPVMVAVGKHKETNGFVLGFGCHLQPELAAQRALTELCQLIPIRDQNSAPFDFDNIEDLPYLYPHQKHYAEVAFTTSTEDMKNDILAIVEQLHSLNLETLALDYTREPFPINTAKVFVPGLCHIWPQLANERLYQLPIKMGWLKQANTEATINQQALYI